MAEDDGEDYEFPQYQTYRTIGERRAFPLGDFKYTPEKQLLVFYEGMITISENEPEGITNGKIIIYNPRVVDKSESGIPIWDIEGCYYKIKGNWIMKTKGLVKKLSGGDKLAESLIWTAIGGVGVNLALLAHNGLENYLERITQLTDYFR